MKLFCKPPFTIKNEFIFIESLLKSCLNYETHVHNILQRPRKKETRATRKGLRRRIQSGLAYITTFYQI